MTRLLISAGTSTSPKSPIFLFAKLPQRSARPPTQLPPPRVHLREHVRCPRDASEDEFIMVTRAGIYMQALHRLAHSLLVRTKMQRTPMSTYLT